MNDASNPTPADCSPTRTDWNRLTTISDDEIARAVAEDADAAPILNLDDLRREYRPHAPRLP